MPMLHALADCKAGFAQRVRSRIEEVQGECRKLRPPGTFDLRDVAVVNSIIMWFWHDFGASLI
jgi:hypothetical protein